MSTLFWLILGLVVVVILLLLAIGVVLILFREPTGKRAGSKKNARNTNGAPHTTGRATGDKLMQWLQSAFSVQTFVVMAAFVALEFALWHSGWLPKMFEWPGILQIPIYGIFIFITNLVEEKTTGKLKTGARFMMIVAFTILGLGHLDRDKLAAWWNTPSGSVATTPVPDRRVARTPTEPCDNIYRPYRLNNRPKPILRTDGCIMDWHVTDDGTVILTDAEGRDMPYLITKDTPDDLVTPLATKWRSRGSTALVEARFYRQ